MATTRKTPKLERPVKLTARRIAWDQLRSYALARAPRGKRKWSSVASIRTILAAKARAKAGPLPDEPNFNEETMQVLRDAREGKGLVRYDTWDDLFADLGI